MTLSEVLEDFANQIVLNAEFLVATGDDTYKIDFDKVAEDMIKAIYLENQNLRDEISDLRSEIEELRRRC